MESNSTGVVGDCKMCNKPLYLTEELCSTYCGHVFHQKCATEAVTESSAKCAICNALLEKEGVKQFFRTNLPEFVQSKTDIEDKLQDMKAQIGLLAEEEVKNDKELKAAKKKCHKLLNEKKKLKKSKKRQLAGKSQMKIADDKTKTVKGDSAVPEIDKKELRRIKRKERVVNYFMKKKQAKKSQQKS